MKNEKKWMKNKWKLTKVKLVLIESGCNESTAKAALETKCPEEVTLCCTISKRRSCRKGLNNGRWRAESSRFKVVNKGISNTINK